MARTARPLSLPGFFRKPLATVRVTDAEFALHGVVLEPLEVDWEEPGPIEGAKVVLPGGDVWLIRYVDHGELGVEVRTADRAFGGYLTLRSLLRRLGLDQDRLMWVSEAAARPRHSRHRGRSAGAEQPHIDPAATVR